MRLKLILPVVKPGQFEKPKRCVNPKCGGKHFIPFQEGEKNLRDTVHQEVTAWRYKCVGCGCTFRVYPQGVQTGIFLADQPADVLRVVRLHLRLVHHLVQHHDQFSIRLNIDPRLFCLPFVAPEFVRLLIDYNRKNYITNT